MIKTSREVFDDPIDRDRYSAQEYAAIVGLGDAAPAERVTDWRRWCWYLASLDGFPETFVKQTGEVIADRSAVADLPAAREVWTAFAQRASIHDLADAMLNRYFASRLRADSRLVDYVKRLQSQRNGRAA
jgi:hypothetical protein